jgi:hypothetical protein
MKVCHVTGSPLVQGRLHPLRRVSCHDPHAGTLTLHALDIVSPFDSFSFDWRGNVPYRLMRGGQGRLVHRFEEAVRDPESAQRQVLARVLDGVRNTAFGQDHDLSTVDSVEAFRSRVPISAYESLAPYILRIAAGERGVLTEAPVRHLLETSGTTGAQKWIPATATFARGVSAARMLWLLGLVREHEMVTGGAALPLASPGEHGRTSGGLTFGSSTGRMLLEQPWWVRVRCPVPYAVFMIPDPEARIYTILRFAIQADVKSITAARPSTVLQLFRKLEEHREPLETDLADGTLTHGPATSLPRRLRRSLEIHLAKRRPSSGWRPRDLWDLVAVNCRKGGATACLLPSIQEYIGPDVAIRDLGISASEGFLAIALSGAWDGGVAWPLGEFQEYVDDAGVPHTMWEIETGGVYRVVLTGTHGLYRYDLGDVVQMVGTYRHTPVLRFLRRATDSGNAVHD